MSAQSSIEWLNGGATWNPISGCARVSEGCRRCYAEAIAGRFSGPTQPFATLAKMVIRPDGKHEARWTGNVLFHPKRLQDPLRWRKPRLVFVNSMSDLFHELVPFEIVDQIFAVMALASRHTFIILTKRAQRMRDYLANRETDRLMPGWEFMPGGGGIVTRNAIQAELVKLCDERGVSPLDRPVFAWPLRNLILGVSAEDQATADERIPLLTRTPAYCRMVSFEPLLGPIHVDSAYSPDWWIAGAESGSGARSCNPDWVRLLRDQCAAAGGAFFYKQAAERGRKIPTPQLDGRQWTDFPAQVATP